MIRMQARRFTGAIGGGGGGGGGSPRPPINIQFSHGPDAAAETGNWDGVKYVGVADNFGPFTITWDGVGWVLQLNTVAVPWGGNSYRLRSNSGTHAAAPIPGGYSPVNPVNGVAWTLVSTSDDPAGNWDIEIDTGPAT